jgi:AraC-like DNA-binding protein
MVVLGRTMASDTTPARNAVSCDSSPSSLTDHSFWETQYFWSDFAQPLDVSALADEAGMSVPAFHANFRALTLTSPIQYIKSTRLHQARLMMIRDGLTAASASARVGYESPSQFSREFKRFFGRSPADEARDMRASFALSPAAIIDDFVTSH